MADGVVVLTGSGEHGMVVEDPNVCCANRLPGTQMVHGSLVVHVTEQFLYLENYVVVRWYVICGKMNSHPRAQNQTRSCTTQNHYTALHDEDDAAAADDDMKVVAMLLMMLTMLIMRMHTLPW